MREDDHFPGDVRLAVHTGVLSAGQSLFRTLARSLGVPGIHLSTRALNLQVVRTEIALVLTLSFPRARQEFASGLAHKIYTEQLRLAGQPSGLFTSLLVLDSV